MDIEARGRSEWILEVDVEVLKRKPNRSDD